MTEGIFFNNTEHVENTIYGELRNRFSQTFIRTVTNM